MQEHRTSVPAKASQVREVDPTVRARWVWVEALVWTDRMLTALEQGVQGDVWFTLINRTLRGWFEYFKHSHRSTFPRLDGWLRMRLRSILRKRQGKRGCGRGSDHQRWPNRFFAALGLYSLQAAHRLACQSAKV